MRRGNTENTATTENTVLVEKIDVYRLDGHGEVMDSHSGRDWTLLLTKSPCDGARFAYSCHNDIDCAAAEEHHNFVCVRWLGHDRLPLCPGLWKRQH